MKRMESHLQNQIIVWIYVWIHALMVSHNVVGKYETIEKDQEMADLCVFLVVRLTITKTAAHSATVLIGN